MLKSQYDSTDIYSDESQSSNQIVLKLDQIDAKWSLLFLNAEGSDFRIYHRDTFLAVHRAVIFKHVNLHVLDDEDSEGCLHAPDELKTAILTGVLSCLYGLELKICRSEALDALDVIHFLKIAKLKKMIEDDIMINFEDYELFPLLEKAKAMSMQDVQELCWKQLELQGFEQMRYGKYELLQCTQEIFKAVVHRHNERRWEDPAFGLSDKFIQELIQEYCKHWGYNQRRKNLLLKSFNELSVKSDIPLLLSDPKVPNLNLNLNLKDLSDSNNICIKVYTPRTLHTQSAISPASYFKSKKSEDQGSRSMIMDLTFMSNRKRKTPNRGSENNSSHSKMCIDAIALKEGSGRHEKDIQELKDTVEKLDTDLACKQAESQNNKFRLSEIQRLLEQCQRDIMESNRNSRLLEVRFNKIEERRLRNSGDVGKVEVEKDKEDEGSSDEDEEKTQNPKDGRLRVSLVQSRWVCC